MTLPLPSTPPPLIVPAERAEDYLRGLGISVQGIYDGVELGDLRAADIDSFYPRGSAGVTRWIGTVGGLRRNMVDGGQCLAGGQQHGWQDKRGQQGPLGSECFHG